MFYNYMIISVSVSIALALYGIFFIYMYIIYCVNIVQHLNLEHLIIKSVN